MDASTAAFMATAFAMPAAFVVAPFAPPLVFGLARAGGLIHDGVLMGPSFAGFASPGFIALAAVLHVAHALADKAPPLAHALDAFGIVAKPLAIAFIGLEVSNRIDPTTSLHWLTLAAAVAGGAPAAAAPQLIKAKVRLAASALTLGAVAPVISGAENLTGLGLSALAFTHPWIALALILAVAPPLAWFAARRMRMAGRGLSRFAGLAQCTNEDRPRDWIGTASLKKEADTTQPDEGLVELSGVEPLTS